MSKWTLLKIILINRWITFFLDNDSIHIAIKVNDVNKNRKVGQLIMDKFKTNQKDFYKLTEIFNTLSPAQKDEVMRFILLEIAHGKKISTAKVIREIGGITHEPTVRSS